MISHRKAFFFIIPLFIIQSLFVRCEARTLEVGADRPYKLLSEAVREARDGDKIVILAGEYFDCAVIPANDLTIEGVAPNAGAIITDKACGGKALLVTVGNNMTIRNLTLARARVPDGNGAGIRAEGKNLTIEGVKFINNQNGILGAVPGATITIRNSEFVRDGTCINSGGCGHGVYAGGELELLHIENTRFFETREGHHIKSRALRTEIIGCDIRDGSEGTASYLIDIPNGGSLVVRDTVMEKGPKSQNYSAAISIGAEGITHRTQEIVIKDSSFQNDNEHQTIFVRNITATEAQLSNNKLSGQVKPLEGDGTVH